MRVILLPVVAAILVTVGCRPKKEAGPSGYASANATDTIIRRVKADRDTIIRNSAGRRDTFITHVPTAFLADSCKKVPPPEGCQRLLKAMTTDTIIR